MDDEHRNIQHDPPSEQPRELSAWERPIGRRAFIGTVATGLGGLFLLSRSQSLTTAVENVTASINPSGGWRIYAVQSPMPVFDPATYKLKISGEVENPMELSWADIQKLPSAKMTHDFHCVTGWSIQNVKWEGILPQTIVDQVKPKPSAQYVSMQSL